MKILVLITTYNRPDFFLNLLKDINGNKEEHEINLLIYNDASIYDYGKATKFLKDNFKDYKYIVSKHSHGKPGYWKLIDNAYKEVQNHNFDYVIQLPDDVRLVPGFFSRATNLIGKIKDNKKVCLNLLNDARLGKASWTGQKIKSTKVDRLTVYKTGWVDMCYIASRDYFKVLDFSIKEVKNNWTKKPGNSSGVGKQISKRLVNAGYSLYQVHNSFVIHGKHESVMHNGHRKSNPLITNHNQTLKNNVNYKGLPSILSSHNDHIGKILQKTKLFYEMPMLDYIKKLNKPGIYVDAGSNIGNHAVFFATHCTNKVVAIEPVPANFKILEDNISFNKLNDVIKPIRTALSLTEGDCSFSEFPNNMGMCSIIPGKGIKTKRLDSIEFDGRVGLLKIDCEKMDYDVLQSGVKMINKDKPDIFIEAQNEDLLNNIKNYLSPLNYVPKAKFNSTPTYHFQYVRDKITACMAAIPSRENVLRQVVGSIINQVDELIIYLNGYDKVPNFLLSYKIKVYQSQHENGDLGDAGKFYKVGQLKGFILSIDDDLIYPPDYVQKLISKINSYGRQAVISFHGRVLKSAKINNYYSKSSREFYRCLRTVKGDHPVHIGGTGVMGFHSSVIKITVNDFKIPNMADVWLAKKAQEQNIPIVVSEHEDGWIKHAAIDMTKTIAHQLKNKAEKVTEVVNSINWTIMKAKRKIDLVIPYITSKNDFIELKYALRSIEKNLDADFRIVIIGDLPDWINPENVYHISHVRDDKAKFTNCYDVNNKMNKLLLSDEISDDFVITYDDVYFLKKTTIEDLKEFFVIKKGKDSTASSTWKGLLNATFDHLKLKGLPVFNFETHLPRLINKTKMRKVYEMFRPIRHRLLHFTLYFNTFMEDNIPVLISQEDGYERVVKAGFYGVEDDFSINSNKSQDELIKIIGGYLYLNHDDKGLSENLKKVIKKLFNKKSKYEL